MNTTLESESGTAVAKKRNGALPTTTATEPAAPPAAESPRPMWWRLYFVLAAFDLITISFSLYLNHRLIRIHDESVRVNQEWATRLSQFSDVAQLGGEVNAPGNDVFDSHNVDAESARLRASLSTFDRKLAEAEAELFRNLASAETGSLRTDMALVREAMKEMVEEAELIFSYFRQNLPDKAGERMATMDRKYAKLNGGFAQLSRHIREIQAENFQAQQAESVALRRYEWSIAGAIVFMVLAVTLYGHRMSRTMAAVMAEKERYLHALHEAHAGLEQRVAERTKELREEIHQRELAQKAAEEAQESLIAASRQAGMAEVATGVLHNVGNVLNSVNIAASTVVDKLRVSKVDGLAKAAALLASHEADLAAFLTSDAQGRRLPGYLGKLSGILVEENAAMRAELEQLARNIEHIKQIVARQQSYARASGVLEDVPADSLVEDALGLNTESFARHGIEIVRDFQAAPPVRVDKHKVLQILINLLRNSKHAVEDAGRPDRRIGIAVQPAGDRVRIAVTDNGVGIAPENLSSVFRHGFTTRKTGHGFGLHSGANAAREMGGTLTAASPGPGRGAIFTLELPSASTTPNS